jgi:hypothetical protein
MKLGRPLLLLALTAGLAAVAVTSARSEGEQDSTVTVEDADAWFV